MREREREREKKSILARARTLGATLAGTSWTVRMNKGVRIPWISLSSALHRPSRISSGSVKKLCVSSCFMASGFGAEIHSQRGRERRSLEREKESEVFLSRNGNASKRGTI
jgi:hypothetical protein